MKLFSKIGLGFVAITTVIVLSSAVPVTDKVSPERVKAATEALTAASADGKVTYKELKSIATDLKGAKLTLKERVALKIFGKKISSKITSTNAAGGGKSQLVAALICFFVGGLGIHRFYLGYTWQGIVQLLTLGGCGIWSLIDFIRILLGTLKPKDGEYEKTL